jgi:hypothetical protein
MIRSAWVISDPRAYLGDIGVDAPGFVLMRFNKSS